MYLLISIALIIILLLVYIYKLSIKSLTTPYDYDSVLQNINNTKSLDLFNNCSSYRLGDGFYLTDSKSHWKNNDNHKIDKHNISLNDILKKYKNSILSEYILESKYKNTNWNILIKIVNKKFIRDKNINKNTHCLVHIRIGDVIDDLCRGDNFIKKFYDNINNNDYRNKFDIVECKYIKPLKYFKDKIKKLVNVGITKVYLIAGAHIKLPSYKYSTYYINNVVEEIKKMGLQVEIKLGGNPDDDLLFSMNFNYFVPSRGQYCRLIEELNKKINQDFVIL